MATKSKAAAGKPDYPKNLAITGQLSFPLWNETHLLLNKERRSQKNLPKPKYPEKVGGIILIKQPTLDKIKSYILEEFLPFATALNAFDDDKGFPEEVAAIIKARVEAEDWSLDDEYTLPIRNLSDKDMEALGEDTEFVAKFAYAGSGGKDISAKLLFRDDNNELMVKEVSDVDGLPPMEETLFWGSRNTFRGSFNLNAYIAAKTGISAYTRTLYLRSDLPMTWGGGSDDEAVLEDDFED